MTASQLLPRLEPRERGRFYLTALAFMCVATGALFSRTFGDALFLSKLGSGPLPFMYMAGAIVTGIGSYACARAANRLSTARVAILVAALTLVTVLGIYATLGIFPTASRVIAYTLADVAGRIPILLFWAYASEIFDAGQSRRLFGLLGAAGTASCLPAGLLVGPLARRFGTGSLALVIACLMAGFILALTSLSRREREAAPGPARRTLAAASAHSSFHLHRSGQFLTISGLFAVTALVQTLIDYQFKAAFAPLGKSAALAGVFGNLYAFTSVAALLIQIVLVHRILQWGGVLISLCVMPAALFAASAGVLRTAASSLVFYTKALDVTLTLTLNGTARQLLYRGIRSESRLQARAFAEGLYQPIAVGIAGSALAAATGAVSIRTAAGAAMAGCLIWLFLVRGAYSSYVAGLLGSIRGRRFDAADEPFSAREPALEAYVREELSAAPDEDVIYLAAILPELGNFTDTSELAAAMGRDNPRVKAAILDYLRLAGLPKDDSGVLALTQFGDPEVRYAAVRCAATRPPKAGIEWLLLRLEDIDPRVRAAAAAALINTARPGAVSPGRQAIEELARSGAAENRAAAASGIQDIKGGDVRVWLSGLLSDPDESVRRAALDALRLHPDASLLPLVLPSLGQSRLAAPAAEALAAMGPGAVVAIAAVLDAPGDGDGSAAAKRLPAVLSRIGDPAALPALARRVFRLPPEDRASVIRAYAALVERQPSVRPYLAELDALIARETAAAAERSATWRALGGAEPARLARSAVSDLIESHLRNAFFLLDARVQEADMSAIYAGFTHATREGRSQILELLHNLVPEHLRNPLLDVLSRPSEETVEDGAGVEAAVGLLLGDRDSDWAVAGALYAAGGMGLSGYLRQVESALRSENPVLRETGLYAMREIADPVTFARSCRILENDPDVAVRAAAAALGRPTGGEI